MHSGFYLFMRFEKLKKRGSRRRKKIRLTGFFGQAVRDYRFVFSQNSSNSSLKRSVPRFTLRTLSRVRLEMLRPHSRSAPGSALKIRIGRPIRKIHSNISTPPNKIVLYFPYTCGDTESQAAAELQIRLFPELVKFVLEKVGAALYFAGFFGDSPSGFAERAGEGFEEPNEC